MSNKEHVDKIIESKFNRQRASTETLRANCSTGYAFTHGGKAARQSEYHHILPVETIQDASIEPSDELDFFHNCMAMTTWDINESENLIGLPTKIPYLEFDRDPDRNVARSSDRTANKFHSQIRNLAAALGAFGTIPDLPCHKNDHPRYNEDLILYIQRNVWQVLQIERQKCKIQGKSILKELRSASSHWRKFLVNRGADHGGAAHCWENREKPEYAEYWFIPLSLDPGTPRKVPVPPRYAGSNRKAWLKSLLS